MGHDNGPRGVDDVIGVNEVQAPDRVVRPAGCLMM